MIRSMAGCIVALSAALVGGEPMGRPLLLTGARLLDVTTGQLGQGQDVFITAGRIGIVGRNVAATTKLPAETVTLDLSELVLMPGLIDLHTHLLLHPYDEAAWNDQVLKESLGLRTIRAVGAARATLQAGFTTIRDLGTEGAGYADVALRDAVTQGVMAGPRIYAVTRALVTTGGYGPAGFDPRWVMPKGAQVADGPASCRRAVREQIAAGADWIKVYADYRRRPGDPSTPTFSMAELEAIIDEARSAGVPVAAHANTAEGMRRATLAGMQTIEHGSGLTAEVAALMVERSVVLCPTLAASEAMARYGGWNPGEKDHPGIVEAKRMMKIALEAGVTIACGSDAGVFSHGDNAREIELMVEYGMKPLQALRAATVTAAGVLGRRSDLGAVETGYAADLIAVRANPLNDLGTLRRPVVVIKSGTVVVRPNGPTGQ
ncbi:MAG: amidohydrolase family protein [Phycisphaerae bacterium]